MDVLSLIRKELPKFFTEMGVPFLGKDAPARSVMQSGPPEDSQQEEKRVLETILTGAVAAFPLAKGAGVAMGLANKFPKTAAVTGAAATGDPTALIGNPILSLAASSNPAEAMVVPARYTHSADEISRALAAIRKGENPFNVYQAGRKGQDIGGIYLGPKDDKIKSVISDKDATVTDLNATSLGALLSHPQLFSRMPELANIKVKQLPAEAIQEAADRGNVLRGGYNQDTDTLSFNPTMAADQILSTILHETQHGVQKRSNFASGSSIAKSKLRPELQSELNKAMVGVPDNAPEAKLDEILNSVLYDLYKRGAGETEARATQAMHAKARYTDYPIDLYDVPQSQLLSPPPK